MGVTQRKKLYEQSLLYVMYVRAFAKLRKVTISFVMSVRLYLYPHGTFRLQLDEFSENFIPEDSSKRCSED
jgi:hypothetical protein